MAGTDVILVEGEMMNGGGLFFSYQMRLSANGGIKASSEGTRKNEWNGG